MVNKGSEDQVWGKGYCFKAVINAVLKSELWIGHKQEGREQPQRGQDKDTTPACLRRLHTNTCTREPSRMRPARVKACSVAED